jgi:hypothetical protein
MKPVTEKQRGLTSREKGFESLESNDCARRIPRKRIIKYEAETRTGRS